MSKLKRQQSLEVVAKLQNSASLVSRAPAPAVSQEAPILFDLVGDSMLLDCDTKSTLVNVEHAFDSVASKVKHRSLGCRVLTLQQFPEFLIHMGIDNAMNAHDVAVVFNELSHTMIHGSTFVTLEDLQQCGMKWKIYKEFLNPDPMNEDFNAFYQSFVASKRENSRARRLILMEIEFAEPTATSALVQNKLERMTACFDGHVTRGGNQTCQVEFISSLPVDRIVHLFSCKDFTVKRHRYSELVMSFNDHHDGDTTLLGNRECLRAVKQMQRVCQRSIPSQFTPWALFVYGGTQHARLAVLSVLQQSKIAHWEDFVELNVLDFSPELESQESQSVLQACQLYCFKHKQNVLKYCPEESTWEDLLQGVLEFKPVGSAYRVGVIIAQDGENNRFAKRQNLSYTLDFADEHLFALNLNGDLDLVCWTVTHDASSTPRISRVLSNLPLSGQDCWQRSLGSLLSIDNQRDGNNDDNNHMMLKRFILPTRFAIDFIITSTPQGHQQQDEAAALVRRTWNKLETLVLTQYSPEKVHASISTEQEMVKVMDALNLPNGQCLVGKRIDQLDEVSKVLSSAFAWLISSHGSVADDGSSLVLDGRVVEEQEIVDMCRKASEDQENGGKLRLVFLNICGNAKSRLAQRLSTECNIPFVIYWETKCLDRVCSILSRAFFFRLQEMLSSGGQDKYLSHCVCGAFEYAKTVVETVKHEESMGYDRQFNMYKFGDMANRPVAAGMVRNRDLVYVGQVRLLSNHFEVLPSHTFQVKTGDQALGTLRLSPLSEVTLSGIPREEAMIPIEAKSFAYCHPPDKSLATKMRLGGGSGVGEFAQFGGFAYFSPDQRVLQINALCKSAPRGPGSGALKLSRQVILAKSEWITVLQLAGRLEEMPHNPQVQLGWILPFERISPSAPQFDLGAFIQVSQGENGRIWPVA